MIHRGGELNLFLAPDDPLSGVEYMLCFLSTATSTSVARTLERGADNRVGHKRKTEIALQAKSDRSLLMTVWWHHVC